jgi:hypothetical protein
MKKGKSMETTLNIRIDILELIIRASKTNGIPCSEMILLLIEKVMGDIADPDSIGRMVQYQERRRPEEWHTFHIQLREDMYEYWLDLKKLLKMSVSLILAHAVKKYLGKLVKRVCTDNNRFRSYIIIKELVDDIIIWKLIWGIPCNLERHIT